MNTSSSNYRGGASSAPQHQPPVPPRPEPEPPPPPPQTAAKPRLVEVDLVRRYAPHWIINDDGTATSNEGQPVEVLMPAQAIKLHYEDAGHALQHGIAMPTRNTYRDV